MKKVIFYLFALLFFFVPLILWPYTSEVFEFNKMVLVYILTVLITSVWISECIIEKKFIFRRTILDIPLLVFLGSQLISTLLSIDPRTSWLGYYSRFNGGLFSTICYSLLYWAFVSNLTSIYALYAIRSLLFSASLVCLYAVLEHFGIDKNIWVQDVASRVFSTLGQPNWLAAWIVALSPLAWASAIANFQLPISKQIQNTKFKILNTLSYLLSILFFVTLLFTKSRSGLLGFAVAEVIFWSGYFWTKGKENIKKFMYPFVICNLSFVILALAIGTQFTPNINELISKSVNTQIKIQPQGPALEVGGTESGTIRKIVWKGALSVWKNYPMFGSGVETFAYSYYQFRPAEHNLVSEWDFIYNKAHNEFLNTAATSGTLGLLSYLVLIGFSIYQVFKSTKFQISNSKQIKNSNFENSKLFDDWLLKFGILAGYSSLLVTNFFGFSVVPTQLEFFLFPAIADALMHQSERVEEYKTKRLTNTQKLGILFACSLALLLLYSISCYWYSDYLFNLGRNYNTVGKYDLAENYLTSAIKLMPNEPLYHNEIASTYVSKALEFSQQKNTEETNKYKDLAISESNTAVNLSPNNVNLKRTSFGVNVRLSAIDPNYLLSAGQALIDAIKLAPTDAKLYYNLGLVYARTGQGDLALSTLQKTIDLKANYKEARLAYAFILIDKKETAKAKEQLEYILTKIDPKDSLTKQTLESLK